MKTSHFSTLVMAILLSFALWPIVGDAVVTLQFEQRPIQTNDTLHIVLTSDNPQSGALPDLTPLQKDFSILGTERNLSYTMIDGKVSSSSQWIILLRPNKSGTLVIPAIKIGAEQTKPSEIEVSDDDTPTTSESSGQDSSDDVMLKTSVDDDNPYVNQQIIYTVRLYSDKPLINAEYRPPSVENALFIPLANVRHYQTQVNDHTYSVEEQQYAIFPQKSGTLTILPPSFHAAVFNDFSNQVTVHATETTLEVRPTPTDYQGKRWLPAIKVTLAETYEPSQTEMKVGDTLTRIVTLKAVAMPAQLLPTPTFETNGTFNVYLESPEVKNTIKLNDLIGRETIKVTYLLNQAGRITIPALEVPWLNTLTDKTEVATLPAHTLTIKPNPKSDVPQNNANTNDGNTLSTTKKPWIKKALSHAHPTQISSFITGFGLALGLMLCGWFYRKNRFSPPHQRQTAIKRLQNACQKHLPNLARDALFEWARAQWPETSILNLQDIAKLAHDPALKKQLLILNKVLYHAEQQASWKGDALWQAFETYQKVKPDKEENHRSDLPPINPH